MSVYCQELNERIVYGDPFFILIRENKPGGVIISNAAMNRVSAEQRLQEKVDDSIGVNVYEASSSYSNNDSYSWFDIRKEEFLFAVKNDVLSQVLPNSKKMFDDSE